VQGNCLFNALSDQLYGHQEMHEVLRTATIEHMRDNSDFYRQYMAVNNVRRNPKRKTAAAVPTRIDTTYFTEAQLQQQFEEHVEKMGQPGEWADNMEVSAFASALNVHVRLWQADYTYLFSPRVHYVPGDDPATVDDRQTLHIAYHVSLYKLIIGHSCSLLHRPGNITPLSARLQAPILVYLESTLYQK
jgi:OTU domain-containing protein 3